MNALRQWDKTIADVEANTSYCLNEMRQSVLDSLQKKADYLLVEKLHQKVGAKPDHEQVLKEINKTKAELTEEVTRRVQGCAQDFHSRIEQLPTRSTLLEELAKLKAKEVDETAQMLRALSQTIRQEN